MPALICSSRYTVDSQILRQTAQSLGWETLRLDGDTIPEWFEPPDSKIAFFYTAPHAFEIARQLGRTLLGCNPEWTVDLPKEFLKRELAQMTLREALQIQVARFIKHAVSKAFPASIYDAASLADATEKVHPDSLVHVGEPVQWESEFRCFVSDRKVMAISPYLYNGQFVTDYDAFPTIPQSEIDNVQRFAESVLNHTEVGCPDAFVLDVGTISGRGWAVVECNECWASGIYACDPKYVLETLLAGNMKTGAIESNQWVFHRHYFAACPNLQG